MFEVVLLLTLMATATFGAPGLLPESYTLRGYTDTYAVADDYSKASFSADETSDGAGNAQGSYSVALPDGRIQRVAYTANGYDGYVADVTYEGTAQYPEAAPAYKAAPAYHAAPAYKPAPVYKAAPVPVYSG